MITKETRKKIRTRIHERIRKKISGTSERPRHQNIYAQIIDDSKGITLAATSSLDAEVKKDLSSGGNTEAAKKVGADIANKAKAKGINDVVFDRGGYIYHGKVKALADSARENGLNF